MFKTSESKIKGLAYYQIAGGAIGLLITGLMLKTSGSNLLLVLLILIGLGLYGYSVWCGVLLLQDRQRGLKYSKINQLLQVLSFWFMGYGFQYASGLIVAGGVDLTTGLELRFNAGPSSWQISLNSGEDLTIVKINLVALYLLSIIKKLQKNSEQKELEQLLSTVEEPSEAQPLT